MFKASGRLLQHRQPMIKFVGRRTLPSQIDHTPHAHPASPSASLPDSFATYRQKAQQHGPLNQTLSMHTGSIGGHSGHSLGPVGAGKGEAFDRNELPARFRRTPWSQAEIDAIDSGGASMFA
ncbi:MAG: hypothetical protein M1820_004224 [Bogoriella megaspora]|nr:MAG: hypothetical protein M1820_004224 [Bogoriella megaspora]